jgi:hypothetical protein
MSVGLAAGDFARLRIKAASPDGEIYHGDFVRRLFDEMSATYSLVNYISSFGFSSRWRRQGLARLDLRPGMVVCDLMSGMGELWPAIARRIGPSGRIVAVDFSHEMCRRSQRRVLRCGGTPVERIEGDALPPDRAMFETERAVFDRRNLDAVLSAPSRGVSGLSHARHPARRPAAPWQPGKLPAIVAVHPLVRRLPRRDEGISCGRTGRQNGVLLFRVCNGSCRIQALTHYLARFS